MKWGSLLDWTLDLPLKNESSMTRDDSADSMNFMTQPPPPKLWSESFRNNTIAMQVHKLLIMYGEEMAPSEQQCFQGLVQLFKCIQYCLFNS